MQTYHLISPILTAVCCILIFYGLVRGYNKGIISTGKKFLYIISGLVLIPGLILMLENIIIDSELFMNIVEKYSLSVCDILKRTNTNADEFIANLNLSDYMYELLYRKSQEYSLDLLRTLVFIVFKAAVKVIIIVLIINAFKLLYLNIGIFNTVINKIRTLRFLNRVSGSIVGVMMSCIVIWISMTIINYLPGTPLIEYIRQESFSTGVLYTLNNINPINGYLL